MNAECPELGEMGVVYMLDNKIWKEPSSEQRQGVSPAIISLAGIFWAEATSKGLRSVCVCVCMLYTLEGQQENHWCWRALDKE